MTLRFRTPAVWALALIVGGVPATTLAQDEPEGDAPSDEAPPEEDAVPEEAPEEEAPADDGGLALKQPPPAGKAVIAGIVTDTKYGEPAIDAYVGVVGTKIAVLTDVDGTYRLELPPGTYVLRIAYELHKPVRTSEIVVKAGQIARVDVKVEPEEGVEDVVETVIEVEQASVEGLILQRQKAAAAGDSIGRAEITKGNDRNAAEAAKRVVGANIEGSRFLFVRGLGERYTNALFEGFPLPSPEPDKQAVPLDLFPSQILESLTIVKTFTPDVPGDFAGGSVRIATRRIPNDLTLAGSISLGFNTQATFQEMLSYDGGGLDWLGIDDGTRALPDSVPGYKVGEFIEKGDSPELQTPEEVDAIGRALNTSQSIRTTVAPPNHSGNFVVASSWALGSSAKIGVVGAITYDRRFERRTDEILRTFGFAIDPDTGASELAIKNDLRIERGIDKVNWGVLGGLTLEIGDDHTLSLTGLHAQAADNEASESIGRIEERGAGIVDTRKKFVARGMSFGLLQGKHRIPEAENLRVEYGLGLSHATRKEPDSRGVVFVRDPAGYSYETDGLSGQHFYADQGETGVVGQLDLTQPFGDDERTLDVKIGSAVSARSRTFLARRFNLRGTYTCALDAWDRGCPGDLFRDDAIGPNLGLVEGTRPNDGYDASLDVYAGYAMFDGEVVDGVRFVVGPRVEVSRQSIEPFDPVNRDEAAEALLVREFDDAEVLPAAAFIYSPIRRANLRLSLTRTIARPQLRELAPFAYTDYFGGREVQGNSDLVNTSIVNADTRFEFFPTSAEVVAVSAFYKRFANPIEQVIEGGSTAGKITYQNAEGANLFGIELEGRKSFDLLHPALRPLTLIANVTFAHSRVELDPAAAGIVTSRSRALSYQAPYIANIALDFDEPAIGTRARIAYNVVGERITTVGTRGLPDIYEQPRHVLDVTVGQRIGKHVEVRATASNLIDSPVRKTHGSQVEGEDAEGGDTNVVEEYTLGRTFSVGVGLNY